MIGLPGAGKTSLVKEYKQYLQEKGGRTKLIHVSYDHLIPLGNFDKLIVLVMYNIDYRSMDISIMGCNYIKLCICEAVTVFFFQKYISFRFF